MKPSQSTEKRIILPALVLACLLAPSASPQETPDPRETEQRLTHLRQQLDTITRERRALESERGTAARQLRRADEQVAAAARALHQTQAQLAEQQARVEQLNARRAAINTRLPALRGDLARLLRAAYIEGDIAPLKQLLAQDQVSEIARALVYQHYLQRHRQQRIAALEEELSGLDHIEAELAERQRSLHDARTEQQQRTRRLQRERRLRASTHAALDSRYANQTAREHALGQDLRALEQLLSRLRAASVGTNSTPPLRPGALDWPLSGRVLHRFGQRLADGRDSRGLLIDAALGAPVHAVADGTVVFSEWMTGYGMLLILDHGNSQISLYAHNEALFKQVGESVKRGDWIASVGHSGGQDASALYFELRHDGQPVNPEHWLASSD